MREVKITAEEWLSAERFVNNTLPLLFLVIGLLLFIFIFTVAYVQTKKAKRVVILSCILLAIVLSSYSFLKVKKLATFNELARNQSAAIRDRRKKVLIYEYSKKQAGTETDVLKLQELSFYHEVEVRDEDSITYLGRSEHVHYFKLKKNLYMLNLNSRHIEFQENLGKPCRIGYRYTLTDNAFESIGFYREIGPIYTKLIIPKEMEELVYEDIDERPQHFSF